MRFLSLDLLEGRGPGTRGDELAAEYIATQFALDGARAGRRQRHLLPARSALRRAHHRGQDEVLVRARERTRRSTCTYGTEIVSKDQTGQATADIDAPIVFVGYGIHAPEYHWDDYAGVDVKGKVALVIVNEPPSDDEKFFKGKALTYYGRWTYKYEEAARRGAVGVLIIHRTDLASYGWEVVRNSQAIEKSYLQGDPDATLRAAAWIQHDVAQKLLTLAGLGDLDQAIETAGKPASTRSSFRCSLKGHVESRVRRYDSHQRGRPRARCGPAGEATPCSTPRTTITSASIPTPRATTSTTARPTTAPAAAFCWRWRGPLRSPQIRRPTTCTSHPSPPRSRDCSARSIWACIRPCRRAQITLDLNYDMLLPIGIPRSANLGGAERIDFWPTVQTVAKAFDLALLPDPDPGGRPLLSLRSLLAGARRHSGVLRRPGRSV